VSESPIVFLVDDDASLRKALTGLISSVGLEVQAFSTPAEFLAYTRPDRPACVILDLRMPGASGLDVQERLAQVGADVPVLFLSGHGDVQVTVRAMKAGAVDFLQKPIHDQALLDAVHHALERARERWGARIERQRVERLMARLTPREREVLELVVAGLPNKVIGDRLKASEKTIKLHRARVMEKLEAGSLASLVRLAQTLGIGATAEASPSGHEP
jgi:RNA polymerase sigma factor (sigma-70 family)